MKYIIKEVDKDANSDVAVKVDYIKKNIVIRKNFIFSKELKRSDIVEKIKSSSPSDETLEEEAERLATEKMADDLVIDVKDNLLNIEKSFNPDNFKK